VACAERAWRVDRGSLSVPDRDAVIQRIRLELYRGNTRVALRLAEDAHAADPDPEYAAQAERIRRLLAHMDSPEAYARAYERYYRGLRARFGFKRLEKELRILLGRKTAKMVARNARKPEVQLLEREMLALAPARVFEAGCGEGRVALTIAARHPAVRVDAVDVSPTNVRIASRLNRFSNCAFHLGLIEEVARAFPAGSFDLAYSFDVLEHVADVDTVIAAIVRLLRPGGRVCFAVPMHEFVAIGPLPEFTVEADEPGHVRVFTEAELRAAFGHRAGFVLEKIAGRVPDTYPANLRPVQYGSYFVAFST
jgi:2-polyprenyl-3-methyl-5-hydroxy-6-metoxy-1,4-benzoquinol methylase